MIGIVTLFVEGNEQRLFLSNEQFTIENHF